MKDIQEYSAAQDVNMANAWFDIATLDHFWIKRRFEIFLKLIKDTQKLKEPMVEVGCGNGIVQLQIEKYFGKKVKGFDLNREALEQTLVDKELAIIYDINEKKTELKEHFQTILLFDVLEHIEEQEKFVDSVTYHMSKGAYLIINVPASMSLYSKYDEVVGHQRRYSLRELEEICIKAGLSIIKSTYWGLPLLPLLVCRKMLLFKKKSNEDVIRKGMSPNSRLMNIFLGLIAICEWIPNKHYGTSVMVIAQKL